jgi:excisionase family DNA binding protein
MGSAKNRLFTRHFGYAAPPWGRAFDPHRVRSTRLAHLSCMDEQSQRSGLEPVLTTSQLAAHLGVPVQTIHDLRHAGGGPRGFRVGRELRYRVSEVQAWLERLEADQAERRARPAADAAGRSGER